MYMYIFVNKLGGPTSYLTGVFTNTGTEILKLLMVVTKCFFVKSNVTPQHAQGNIFKRINTMELVMSGLQ